MISLKTQGQGMIEIFNQDYLPLYLPKTSETHNPGGVPASDFTHATFMG